MVNVDYFSNANANANANAMGIFGNVLSLLVYVFTCLIIFSSFNDF